MRCSKCGNELKPDARFCGKCGEIVAAPAYSPASSPAAPAPAAAPAAAPKRRFDFGVNKMPQGIALGVDERIVKQYKIGRYTFRQGSIDVIVTNKRVIRYEESSFLGMQNNQIDEINVDAVHGVYTHMRRSISIVGLICTLVFLIIGILLLTVSFSYRSKSALEYMFGWFSLALSVLIIINSLRPSLEFAVLGSIGNQALGTVVNNRGRLFRNDKNSIIFQFRPTAETTAMLKEIGACIYDLKTLGDSAVEKWL